MLKCVRSEEELVFHGVEDRWAWGFLIERFGGGGTTLWGRDENILMH